ncbi:fungal-specific transcription factor domain-containing protein [Aspergillus venezuelensis]
MPITSTKTKVACKSCNQRRVRCDRTEQAPCSRCRANGQECEPIVSKRGKYKRDRVRRTGFRHWSNEDSALSASPDSAQLLASQTCTEPNTGNHTPVNGENSEDVPEARRDAIIEPQSPVEAQDGRTIYYGDYFNIEYTRKQLDESHEDYKSRLRSSHYLHIDRLGSPTRRLNELGAYDTLDPKVSEQLIQIFFELIHPVAPILNQRNFYLQHNAGRTPPLLLQAIYLVAFLHCEQSVLTAAGFENRYIATFICYQRAKALYDANVESDAIVVLQALYYLSFWWETPTQQKDMWYWTGVVVSLAQSLGMHQEKTYTKLDNSRKQLWRRLWWSIYVRKPATFTILAYRRIPHVNDDYCTTNRLTEQDFEDEAPKTSDLSGPTSSGKECALHTIYLAELCLRVGKCHRSLNQGHPDLPTALKELNDLEAWRTSVPKEIQCPRGTFTLQNGFLSSLLHLRICTFQILLRRNYFQNSKIMAMGTPVFDASVQIVRILEDLLSSELLAACPLRVLPAVFAALSVLIKNLCRSTPSEMNDVSAHRAYLCMLVLSKLIEYWPPLYSYYPMFARILSANGCRVPEYRGVWNSDQTQQPVGFASTTQGEPSSSTDPPGNDSTQNTILGDTDILGMDLDSLFPFSAFLNEDLFEDTQYNPPS